MAPLKLLTVVSASFLALHTVSAAGGATTVTYTATLGDDGKCLDKVNSAREAVGLSDLQQAGKTDTTRRLPDSTSTQQDKYNEWVWQPVCDVLIPNQPKEETESDAPTAGTVKFQSGTYAYEEVDAAAVNCTAVVDAWKSAYKNFKEPPPAYTTDNALYKDQKNVSFMAMYNPSEGATADCRVVTCTKTTNVAKTADDGSAGSPQTESGSALICMTVPDILSKEQTKAPFTDEQWDKIVKTLKGSASAISPSVVGLAVTVLGLAATLL